MLVQTYYTFGQVEAANSSDQQRLDSRPQLHYGWVPSPDGRGTVDIVRACIFTIFLCSWSVLCLNIPAKGETMWTTFRRKCLWMIVAVLGPEFVLCAALGQWASARRSVADFRRLGHSKWSIHHAFFADMGGFVLKSPDWVPFPVNAQQIHYLVEQQYIEYPDIDKEIINDKDKMAGFARALTVLQTLWFVLQCIGRGVQHLALTSFELATLAFVSCTMGTFFCWAHKPLDVETPIELHTNTTIAQILVDAGEVARHTYLDTPLDFVSCVEWSWAVYWAWGLGHLKKIGIRGGPKNRPVERMRNDRFPYLTTKSMMVLFFFETLYAGIHMIGWTLQFPSATERLCWQISSSVLVGTIFGYWVVDRYTFSGNKTALRRIAGFLLPVRPLRGKLLQKVAARLSSTDDAYRSRSVPLRALLPGIFLSSMYFVARLYLVVEVFVGLRALPETAFATVNWSKYIPHF